MKQEMLFRYPHSADDFACLKEKLQSLGLMVYYRESKSGGLAGCVQYLSNDKTIDEIVDENRNYFKDTGISFEASKTKYGL